MPLKLTDEQIDAARTPRGAWSAKQLAEWGVPWPPPRGWRKALLRGEEIPGGRSVSRPCCGQCQHWSKLPSYDWGTCNALDCSSPYRKPAKLARAWTSPDEIDGSSSLCTMPNFWCVLFEYKP